MYSSLFILAQVVGLLSLIAYCASMQINNRIKLLILLTAVNLLNSIVYFLLNSVAGGIIALISVVRLIIFCYYAKHNKECPIYLLWFFICLDLVAGFVTFDYWYDILCVMEAIVVTYGTFIKNMTITRICHLFSCIFMFTFNIFVYAYSNMLSEFIGLIFTFVGIMRLDILPKISPDVFEKNIIFATFVKKTNSVKKTNKRPPYSVNHYHTEVSNNIDSNSNKNKYHCIKDNNYSHQNNNHSNKVKNNNNCNKVNDANFKIRNKDNKTKNYKTIFKKAKTLLIKRNKDKKKNKYKIIVNKTNFDLSVPQIKNIKHN